MSSPSVSSATFHANFRYADADAAVAWIEAALGAEQRELVRDEEGSIAHAELALGGSIVMLGSAAAGREPFRSLPVSPQLIYCAVDDPDALHERALAAGAEVALGLADTDYGSRDFTLRDPEGNLWSFGTYRPSA